MKRRIAWMLGLMLVLIQFLGAWHAIVHGKGLFPRAPDLPVMEAGLWADHDNADCQLFQHLAHTDVLASCIALPVSAPATWSTASWSVRSLVLPTHTPYQSRAPPASSVAT
jgi:hypothetical protein